MTADFNACPLNVPICDAMCKVRVLTAVAVKILSCGIQPFNGKDVPEPN
jgi:hypothetical protein